MTDRSISSRARLDAVPNLSSTCFSDALALRVSELTARKYSSWADSSDAEFSRILHAHRASHDPELSTCRCLPIPIPRPLERGWLVLCPRPMLLAHNDQHLQGGSFRLFHNISCAHYARTPRNQGSSTSRTLQNMHRRNGIDRVSLLDLTLLWTKTPNRNETNVSRCQPFLPANLPRPQPNAGLTVGTDRLPTGSIHEPAGRAQHTNAHRHRRTPPLQHCLSSAHPKARAQTSAHP